MPALSLARAVRGTVVLALCLQFAAAHGGQYLPPVIRPPAPPPPPPAYNPGGFAGPGDVSIPTPRPRTTRRPSGPATGIPKGPSSPAPAGPASPGVPAPATGGPSGPTATGPVGRAGAGPRTGGRGGITIEPDATAWHYWWEFNKNPFLSLRSAVHASVRTGSDDFYLGATRKRAMAGMRPTTRQALDKVLPALKRTLDATAQRDITSSGLVAMAKIGRDHAQFRLLDVFRERLAAHDQEVRETAALAIGIAAQGDSTSVDLLGGLLADDEVGRAASGGSVNARTRAFSAYALGLTAYASDSVRVKQRVFELLKQRIESQRLRDRNIKVAAVHGIGLLDPDPRDYKSLQLRGRALAVLEAYFQRKLGAGHEFIQAHVPIAMVRLAGDDTRHCKELFLAELDKSGSRRRGDVLVQSCVQALGRLAQPYQDPDSVDAAVSERLWSLIRARGDAMTRRYALMAVARIGGAANRTALLRQFDQSRKTLLRPWCAVGLGLLAHDRLAAGRGVDAMIVETLHREFVVAKNPDLVGALAVGLGLAQGKEAADDLRARLRREAAKEQMAGYLCIGLALMGDARATDDLHQVLCDARFRPKLMVQAAMALGKLGDKDAAPRLMERMHENANLVTLASCASALGLIGDRRSIDPLTEMLLDTELSALPRAFAAAALGGVCDRRELPWNTPISIDINYRANVETLTDQRAGVLDIL